MLAGIYRLMHSDLEGPANIRNSEYPTVKELVDTVAAIAGKRISVEWVSGLVGVHSRNLRQCTHLLNRLAAALPAGRRDQAAPSVDRGASACGVPE